MTGEDQVAVRKPSFSSDPKVSLVYGDTILDLDVRMDARDQVSGADALSWDMANQQEVTAAGDEPSLPQQGNVEAATLAGAVSSESDQLVHAGFVPEPELKAWADSRVLRSRMARIQGRVRCTGFGGIRPGDLIELAGIGDRFNGTAFVSGVRHEIGGGAWSTDIQFGLPPATSDDERDAASPAAGRLLPSVHGLQVGVAMQLQDDPDGEFRVLVKMPLMGAEGVWARMAQLDAGDTRGSFFRPEIGDEVVLGFLNNDPRSPVILGMLNSSAKAAPLTPSDDNHIKGFVTRSETKLLFDDEKKSIAAETPGGKKITISDDAGSIVLEDENGNSITLNSDGIALESSGKIMLKAGGDVTVEGVNTEFKASAQLKAEGSAGAELSSSATAVLKGALVQIN
jgi:Rhs element Vgr protein